VVSDAHLAAVRDARLGNLRRWIGACEMDAIVIFDPVGIRYATGSRNMQIYTARNPSRYLFVPVEGPVILFEYRGCDHLAAGLATVDEIRPARPIMPLHSGRLGHHAVLKDFVADIAEAVAASATSTGRIGIESTTLGAALALRDAGFDLVDASPPIDFAKARKVPGELDLIISSLRCTELGVRAMEEALVPGITENELWAVLHEAVIAGGGDYVETRLLNSGLRTNPWFQEASDRVIQDGDLVAFDTDVVGRYGYFSDFSRTFLAGDRKPTGAQRTLYGLAAEQLEHNIAALAPGITFREYTKRCWDIPDGYREHRYMGPAHGVGMTGEYPCLPHDFDWDTAGYDGDTVIEPNMTLSVESFIGHRDGGEGVKLEEQILITSDGTRRLSVYGLDNRLGG
jgi:Xaa-Pro aminopeptidase